MLNAILILLLAAIGIFCVGILIYLGKIVNELMYIERVNDALEKIVTELKALKNRM